MSHGDFITAANQAVFVSGQWERTKWRGVPVFKYPEDLWTYQEIITELWPSVIIETGTAQGGSAVYFQDLLDILPATQPRRRVITVDLVDHVATHDARITYVRASSSAPATFEHVKSMLDPADTVMVALDSEHLVQHVAAELELWPALVTPGQYLVTEDTFISRYGCEGVRFRQGSTWEALEAWLPHHPEFVRDTARDRHLLTMNPGGWLKRVEEVDVPR